jgi:hypothetical protein
MRPKFLALAHVLVGKPLSLRHQVRGRTFAAPARKRSARSLWVALAITAALTIAATTFISYVLWPTWPKSDTSLDVPAMPVTVAGVLFNVPPAAIRAAVQRHPGAHERVDLVFLWPSLAPPPPDGRAVAKVSAEDGSDPIVAPRTDDRLFVTIAALGPVLLPLVRLRTIYPRYIEAQAAAGPDGLAIVPFHAGTPYEGEDLIYVAEQPEQFFALCSRALRAVPGICIHERAIDATEVSFRFSREWLQDWRSTGSGFDRLLAQLHGQGN